MNKLDKSKYMDAFVDEAKEQIGEMNRLLMLVESGNRDPETVNELFRFIHTLKGTSAILERKDINDLSHMMENILDKARSGVVIFTPELVNILFEGIDRLETMVNKSDDKVVTYDGIMKKLAGFLDAGGEDKKSTASDFMSIEDILATLPADGKAKFRELAQSGEAIHLASVTFHQKCKLVEGRAFQMLRDLGEVGTVLAAVPKLESLGKTDSKVFQILFASNLEEDKLEDMIYQIPEVASVMLEKTDVHHLEGPGKSGGEKAVHSLTAGETIRVNVNLLDNLLNLVGESMINNIQINQAAQDLKHKGLTAALKTSNMLIEELQHYVLQVRMVPLDSIFSRFPRMVRDMAKESSKQIHFITEGGDIEIDRGLLDEIGDSLVHLMRNSVDHGIEPAEVRKKMGKDPTGTIKLSAHTEHSMIVVQISDDGNGIDPEKISTAAITAGMLTEGEAAGMTPNEKMFLIFRPGLSTAEKVTKVSGRGVGLDVVNRKISSLGGSVSIESIPAKGTTMKIKLPPTMAIIKALLVGIRGERYAIPLEHIIETVKISRDEIHLVNGTHMFKLRDEVLPLIFLGSEFTGGEDDVKPNLLAVIVGTDSKAGLVVDSFIDQQEIVVKSIGKELRTSKFFSGATILGDGTIAMIVDVGTFL